MSIDKYAYFGLNDVLKLYSLPFILPLLVWVGLAETLRLFELKVFRLGTC